MASSSLARFYDREFVDCAGQQCNPSASYCPLALALFLACLLLFGMGILDTGLSKKELDNLNDYKYSSIDYSPVSKYILSPYWNWVVTLFPLWMAPNLITLLGLAFVTINFVTALIYLSDLRGPASSWVYYSFAAGIWLYSTFDNVDGKQARRTQSSSPLGELFDHGCDALIVVMVGIIQLAGLGIGTEPRYFTLHIVSIVAFYFCTWETYETGSLNLGYVNGPTEGIMLTCFLLCLSGYYGPHIWQRTVGELGFQSWPFDGRFASFTVIDLMMILLFVAFVVYQLPSSIVSVLSDNKKKRKNTPLAILLLRIMPIIFYAGSYLMWATGPYSSAWKSHTYLLAATMSLVFGRMATKIILAHVTKSSFPHPTMLLLPLAFAAYASHFVPSFGAYERTYLWAYFAYAATAYAVWARSIISGFCKHLNINCLTIPYPSCRKQ